MLTTTHPTSVADLKANLGEELGVSGWHDVTQAEVDAFAEATGDCQWIHTNPERARTTPFGGTIAHGYYTLSLAPALLAEVVPVAVSSGRRLAPVVYDLLKERLLEGEYQAGERLSVEALKAEFGVSKQPVMEALRRLSSEGLVEIIPQVGCRVPVYGSVDVIDFFAIFGGMEGAVAGVAARRCTSAQVDELAAVNDEIGRLIANSDPAARAHGYRVLNRRFHGIIHGIIHDMAHSAVVAGISRRMWDMSDLLINTSGVPQPLASAVPARHDDHELIIRALRERDQAAARRAMENHITGTVSIINTEARTAR